MHVFHLCPNVISMILKIMQPRYGWKYRRTGYVQFSSLGQNKMSDYWVYDLKSCRSYMIRLCIDTDIQCLRNFIAGRPKAALLFWFFDDFRCGALFFMVIHVIYKYKNK